MSKRNYQAYYLRRAERVAQLLAGLPFLRMVGLSGSIARGAATKESDIDFFIVTAPGRLYTVRLFATGLIQFLGLRRYGNLIAGRICLNRYHTATDLEIRPHTAYHAQDLSGMIPLVDTADIYPAYQQANRWMEAEYTHPVIAPERRVSRSLRVSQYPRLATEWVLKGRFGNWFEWLAKAFQLRFRELNPTTRAVREFAVLTDTQVLFHPPKEGEVRSRETPSLPA